MPDCINLPEETNRLRFIKHVLQLPITCPTASIIADTGIEPIHFTLVKRIFSYLSHVEQHTSHELLIAAKIEQQLMDELYLPCWSAGVRCMAHILDLKGQDTWEWPAAKTALIHDMQNTWNNKMWENGNDTAKLAIFRQFKTTISAEQYLDQYHGQKRRHLAMFRMGIAHINVEHGRWTQSSWNDRTCPFCPDTVESELHLFRCPRYAHLCDCSSALDHARHSNADILILLAKMEKATCDFIHRSLLIRQQSLDSAE